MKRFSTCFDISSDVTKKALRTFLEDPKLDLCALEIDLAWEFQVRELCKVFPECQSKEETQDHGRSLISFAVRK